MTSPINVDVEVLIDDANVSARLDAMNLRLSQSMLGQFVQHDLLEYLRARGMYRFLAEGDDVSGKWLPLAPATLRIREKNGFPPDHPINKRTGDLMDYITKSHGDIIPSGKNGLLFVYPGVDEQSEHKSIRNKMRIAQKGGKNTRKGYDRSPARPVLGLGLVDQNSILVSLWKYIFGKTV